MAPTYQLLVDGNPANPELYGVFTSLVVEEDAELPTAIQLTLPIAGDGSSDITRINDSAFRPYANLSLVVTPDGGSPQCIFNGYVLSQKLHLDRGLTASTLEVWGQDQSWMMNRLENVYEWKEIDEATVAQTIFGNYNIQAAPENTQEPSVSHTSSGHSLMQRATDIQFLRQLARRNGRLCRVVSGASASDLTGYFAKPNLSTTPVATLTLSDPNQTMLTSLDIEWDVMRPTEVDASQALFSDTADVGASDQATDPGLPLLSDRGLSDFLGNVPSPPSSPMTLILTTTVDASDELQSRTRSVLRESTFFVRASGEVDLAAVGTVVRVNNLVGLAGLGSVHSGNYYVWSVRHTITQDAYRMRLVLVRNAVGNAPSSLAGPSVEGSS